MSLFCKKDAQNIDVFLSGIIWAILLSLLLLNCYLSKLNTKDKQFELSMHLLKDFKDILHCKA